MKKLLFIALIGYGAWYSWQHGWLPIPPSGAFDANGKPKVQLFVGPNCGSPCAEVAAVIDMHGLKYEQIALANPSEARDRGVSWYPTLRVGKLEVQGNFRPLVVSALAETYGDSVLSPMERAAMRGHFDPAGKPKLVVYGAEWCGYCKRERELLTRKSVPFTWVDVERSPEGRLAYDTLQGSGYPVTYVGYRRLKTSQEGEIDAAISELM